MQYSAGPAFQEKLTRITRGVGLIITIALFVQAFGNSAILNIIFGLAAVFALLTIASGFLRKITVNEQEFTNEWDMQSLLPFPVIRQKIPLHSITSFSFEVPKKSMGSSIFSRIQPLAEYTLWLWTHDGKPEFVSMAGYGESDFQRIRELLLKSGAHEITKGNRHDANEAQANILYRGLLNAVKRRS